MELEIITLSEQASLRKTNGCFAQSMDSRLDKTLSRRGSDRSNGGLARGEG